MTRFVLRDRDRRGLTAYRLVMAGILMLLLQPVSADAGTTPIEWTPCALAGTDGSVVRYAECATWVRPLDPHGEVTGSIKLALARLRSESSQPGSDAVLAINGGPGGASREMLVDLWPAFEAIATDRDVIVMDQRGTGASSPLRCGAANSPELASMDAARIRDAAKDCLASLPHDPRFFTTSVAITDIEALRVELGYSQWNVYGVSYGTRVAAHYARRYPGSMRSLILDSVVPPEEILGANVIFHSQTALEALDARCAADPACKQAFGSVLDTLTRLRAEWQTPLRVEFPDPAHTDADRIDLTYAHLAAVIRLLLYAPETAAIIPLIVNETARGNPLPAAAQVRLMLMKLTGSLADGMHNSVVCAEDVPFFASPERERAKLEKTYLGAAMIDSLEAVCSVWPKGPMDPDLHEPLRSDVPALLLAGEFDPITPPAWARQVGHTLTRARTLLVNGQGHSVLARGCAARLVTQFLDSLEPASLRDGCLAHTPRLPPFIDLAGPSP